MGRKRYPLVLMLEPLFRCNLACSGCGKIDYPDPILNRRLSVQECLDAVDECGAPMVAIPGGEPLIHKEIGEIVKGIVARKKFVSLCTNALLLEKKLHEFEPVAVPVLLGPSRRHQEAPRQVGLHGRRLRARHLRRSRPRRRRASPSTSTRRSSTAIRPRTSRHSSISPRSSASAFRSRPATPTSARPTSSTSSRARRPRSCSARCSRSARARAGSSCTPACSSTSSPAIRKRTARRGACRRATSSAGRSPATCSAKATRRPSRS